MELAELKAFMAVAEQGSFSEAARSLHITQPAISKRIAGLEAELDCALFDRVGRQVILTEAGRSLLPRAQRIFLEVEDVRRALSNLSGHVSGKLHIGTSHHIGLHRLPGVLKAYAKQYPQVLVDIAFIDSEMGIELVAKGKIELAIVTLPDTDISPLKTRRVWTDKLVFLAAPDHPLTQLRSLGLAQLANYPAILPSTNTFTRRIVAAKFDAANLQLEAPLSTNYLETIKMMTSVGLGWSVLPETMTSDEVSVLPVKDNDLVRHLGVIYHPGHSLSNAAKAMLELLEEN